MAREIENVLGRQLLFVVFATIGVVVLLLILYAMRIIVLTALIGIGFGVLISPMMNIMHNRYRVPRGISALIVLFLMVFGIGSIFYAIVSLISGQADSLARRSPEVFESIKKQLDQLFEAQPWIADQIEKLNITNTAKSAVEAIFKGVQSGVTTIAALIIVLIVALYIGINSRSYFYSLLSLFPFYLRTKVSLVLIQVARAIRQWFTGQLIVMSISGSMTTLGLWLIGIDYWLLFGVMTMILGIIPYVGVIVTLLVTCLVTLGTSPDKVIWVLGLFLFIQQIEGHLLVPIIMREKVHLPEVPLIILMLILGSEFGILGAFIAPPLLAVLRTIYVMTYVPVMDQMYVRPQWAVPSPLSKKSQTREV